MKGFLNNLIKAVTIIIVMVNFNTIEAFAPRRPSARQQREPRGRMVLVKFDKETQKWNVLLAVDKDTHCWEDFSAKIANYSNNPQQAAQAGLRFGTYGAYDVTVPTAAPNIQLTNGDIFYFVIAPHFILGSDLFAQQKKWVQQHPGQQPQKTSIHWFPIDTILGTGPNINLPHLRSKHPAGTALKDVLSQNWFRIQPQLSAPQPVTTMPVAAAPPWHVQPHAIPPTAHATNWLNIPGAILFYESFQPYYQFTNFWDRNPVQIDNITWPTTEHYFQAQKFAGNWQMQQHIAGMQTPRQVFDFMKGKPVPLNWHTIDKFQAMRRALDAKFTKNPDLRQLLLSTGNAVLVENSGARDAQWGAGADGQGTNHLGRMLMVVRQSLRDNIQYLYDPNTTLTFAQLQKNGFDPAKAFGQPTATAPAPVQPYRVQPTMPAFIPTQTPQDKIRAILRKDHLSPDDIGNVTELLKQSPNVELLCNFMQRLYLSKPALKPEEKAEALSIIEYLSGGAYYQLFLNNLAKSVQQKPDAP